MPNSLTLPDLPTPRKERWKYTDLPNAVPEGLTYADSGFMDSLPEGYTPELPEHDLWAVANQNNKNTIVIDIPAGEEKEPATLNFEGIGGTFTNTHIYIRLGAGVDFTVTENHSGWGAYWRNTVLHAELGQGAKLHHHRLITDSDAAVSTHAAHIRVAEGARYEQQAVIRNAALTRNELTADLLGKGADATINGVLLGSGESTLDQTVLINHMAPDCTSHQMMRNLLSDRARGVFQGKIYVDQVAQRTDGYQLCNSMLLSEWAEMNVKPELEIYADDVKCSHGATMGALDEAALFYCRARGIPEGEAKRMLLEAFLAEVITDEGLFKTVQDFLLEAA